jgi:ribosome biogenesis GTPase
MNETMDPGSGLPLHRVTEVQREQVLLDVEGDELPARVLPRVWVALDAEGDQLAVGDWVQAAPDAYGHWWVHERRAPLTQLVRRLHDGRDKVTRVVLASNVDTALLVMGLDCDFSLRRLERYLALARLSRVGALVVLTKADLCPDVPRRLRDVHALLPPEVAAVAVNGLDPGAADQLAPWLEAGRTLVLLGSSGAGKSTLTNTLAGAALQATGGTRRGDGRGRHTTTSRTLIALPAGAFVIDTPGLRTLRLDADEGAIDAVFDDVARLAPQCRFRDCSHRHEPGCAVRDAVSGERLRSYHKLQREAQRDTMSLLQRQRQRADWRARTRTGRERAREKRS